MTLFTRFSKATVAACLFLCVSLAGCGDDVPDDQPKLNPVKGTVKVKDKPVAGAQIMFSPAGGAVDPNASVGSSSTAITGADGTYTLSYQDGTPGAVGGAHTVTITVGGPTPEQKEIMEKHANGDRSVELPKNIPPQKDYQETATVTEGENTVDFNLE